MRTRFLVVAGLAAALVLPAAAAAKGPETATISGPGLKDDSTAIPGQGEGGSGTPLGTLVADGGYFAAVFGQTPNPMLKSRPKGTLGPRYTVTYDVPGPNGRSTIRQDVYPYAKPYPVTYMKPGQPFWDGQKTFGGWFVASAQLKDALVDAGLPVTAPTGGGGAGFWTTGTIAAFSASLAAALALLAGTALLLRRRPRPAAA